MKRRFVYINIVITLSALLVPGFYLNFGKYSSGLYIRPSSNESVIPRYKEIFPTVTQIHEVLRQFARNYSYFATLYEIGNTIADEEQMGFPVYNLVLSSGFPKPIVIFFGGIYANDLASPLTLIHCFSEWITNNRHLAELLILFDYHFIPLVNPEGYRFAFEKDYLSKKEESKTNLIYIHNPPLPYIGKVEGGLYEGKTIEITGTPQKPIWKDEGMAIYLQNAYDHWFRLSTSNSIGFHLAATNNLSSVLLNTYLNGIWQQAVPLSARFYVGYQFKLKIICGHDEFKVNINGDHYGSLPYRAPLDSLQYLAIKGDVLIKEIKYSKSTAKPQWLKNVHNMRFGKAVNILNNFDVIFNETSKSKWSDHYGGPMAFSERESQIVRDYILHIRKDVAAVISLFSPPSKKSAAITYPYAYTKSKHELWVAMEHIAIEATRALGSTTLYVQSAADYDGPTAGRMDDWIANILKTRTVLNIRMNCALKKDGRISDFKALVRQFNKLGRMLILQLYYNKFSTSKMGPSRWKPYKFPWKKLT